MGIISGGKVIEGALSRRPGTSAEGAGAGSSWARARYDFGVEGGAISTIGLLGALGIPLGAVILDGFVDVVTVPVGAGASIGVGIEAAGDVVADAAISGAPWSTTGRKSIIPAATGATALKTTAARDISVAISGAALTAGVFDVYVEYLVTA